MLKIPVFAAFASLLSLSHGADAIVYEEDFEGFAVADDGLLGNGGWVGEGAGEGLHGIDEVSVEFGRSAFLGYFPLTGSIPSNVTTRVLRPIFFDAVSEGTPEVTVAAFLGIQDSTNDEGDDFFFSVFNSDGKLLASVNFDNSGQAPAIFRFDSANSFPTGAEFFYDEVVDFSVEINFEENRWTAFFGEIPIFIDAPFSAADVELNLGFIGFEFQVFDREPLNPGTNWLFFDEIEVVASGAPAFENPTAEPGGLSYFSEPAFSYQVEHSDDLSSWQADLEGASRAAGEPAGIVIFEDPSPPESRRYYRVRRTLAN